MFLRLLVKEASTQTVSQNKVLMPSLSISICKQALLDEEKVMSAKNQKLRLEIEKLEKQVKAAEEGE